MPGNRSCGSYGPGHLMHWIQAKKSYEDGQPIIKVKVTAVHDDGRAEIEGDDVKLTLWYHDPDHLRSALCLGGRAEWRPKYHVLYVISGGSFNLDRLRPPGSSSNGRCGRTTATRFRRAGWLTWMPYRTATPVNRSLGTWLGSKLPRIQRCWSHCSPTHGRQDTPRAARDPGEGQP
jgi:hypothetical protein